MPQCRPAQVTTNTTVLSRIKGVLSQRETTLSNQSRRSICFAGILYCRLFGMFCFVKPLIYLKCAETRKKPGENSTCVIDVLRLWTVESAINESLRRPNGAYMYQSLIYKGALS